MDETMSSFARSGEESTQSIIQGFDGVPLYVDGARLIAPSMDTYDENELFTLIETEEEKDGFQAALSGAYPLSNPILSLKNRQVYSIDMVRLEFEFDDSQKLITWIDTQMVLCTCESFTSNRIGTYRFMWTFSYADGANGGYEIVDTETGEMITDGGNKDVVLKIGYGVVQKGGKANNRGFVEFNPNKCEKNGRRMLDAMSSLGCLFSLKRYDLAIDTPVERTKVRTIRDKRKYEYIASNGITEYLGQRNNPGRVKIYDKSAEQGIEQPITRIELTVSAQWEKDKILEMLPKCPMFGTVKSRRCDFKATDEIFKDLLYEGVFGDVPVPIGTVSNMFPEKYLGFLDEKQRLRFRNKWRKSQIIIDYDETAIIAIMDRVRTFIPIATLPFSVDLPKLDDSFYKMMGY